MVRVSLRNRPIAGLVGALALAGASPAQAGGWHHLGWCHYGATPTTYTMTGGTPVVAGMNFAGFSSSPMVAGVTPTAVTGFGVPSVYYVNSTPTLASPAVALPMAGFSSGGVARTPVATPQALQAASAVAFAAPEASAQAVEARFPTLAQAARSRNLHGGRFILFLKHLATTLGPDLTGFATGGLPGLGRAALREFLTGAAGNLLGLDAQGSGLGPDIEKIIDEFFGTGGGGASMSGGGGGGSGGPCYTFRVCPDNCGGNGNGNGAGFSSNGAQGNGNTTGQNLLPPLVATAQAPAPPTVAAAAGVDRAEQRHQELLSSLQGINESLRTLAAAGAPQQRPLEMMTPPPGNPVGTTTVPTTPAASIPIRPSTSVPPATEATPK